MLVEGRRWLERRGGGKRRGGRGGDGDVGTTGRTVLLGRWEQCGAKKGMFWQVGHCLLQGKDKIRRVCTD